jgi:hypothetical protein
LFVSEEEGGCRAPKILLNGFIVEVGDELLENFGLFLDILVHDALFQEVS